jgi:hypothetical protein
MRGAHQVAELLVGDAGGGVGPQPDGPLAGLELGVAGAEAAVAACSQPWIDTPCCHTPTNRRRRPTL